MNKFSENTGATSKF